ncbi:MAG TPA: glycosyltransferase, partial [Thermoanaerobaculia bacterium]|nr:glycosyltransferase [Thermoanaerobaculia bacterium]
HNDFAKRLLVDSGVTTPITVIGHPHIPATESSSIDRDALGYKLSDRVIVCLGFITEAKQPAVVLEAFARAARQDASLQLLFVGEPATTVDIDSLIASSGGDRSRVRVVGYVPDADFDAYTELADAVVNLRYPTAGESSGPLVRVLAAGKPVAVSDYAQFAALPDNIVTKIPLNAPSIPLATFMLEPRAEDAKAQKMWIAENADVEKVALRYVEVITESRRRSSASTSPRDGLPLFAGLSMVGASARASAGVVRLELTVRNDGPQIIRARDFGRPVLNILGRAMAGEKEIETVWIPLTADLQPGGGVTLTSSFTSSGITRIELFEALTAVPFFPRSPFAVVDIAS